MWIYVALAGYNTGYLTKKLGAVEIVVDGAAKIAVVQGGSRAGLGVQVQVGAAAGAAAGAGASRVRVGVSGPGGAGGAGRRDWKRLWNKGTDGVIDIPIGGVCEVLYGEGRELEDWEVDKTAPHCMPAAAAEVGLFTGQRGDNDCKGPPHDGAAAEHDHAAVAIWPSTLTGGGGGGGGGNGKSGKKSRKKGGPKHHHHHHQHGGNVKR